jgi:hypothetical protein
MMETRDKEGISKGHNLCIWRKRDNSCNTEASDMMETRDKEGSSKGYNLCIWRKRDNCCNTGASDMIDTRPAQRGARGSHGARDILSWRPNLLCRL